MSYTMMLTTTVEGANTKKRMRRRNMRQFIPLYFMMVPGLVYLLINNYLPLFGLTIAFKDVNYTKGILGSDWVGLKNLLSYFFNCQTQFSLPMANMHRHHSFPEGSEILRAAWMI